MKQTRTQLSMKSQKVVFRFPAPAVQRSTQKISVGLSVTRQYLEQTFGLIPSFFMAYIFYFFWFKNSVPQLIPQKVSLEGKYTESLHFGKHLYFIITFDCELNTEF